MSARSRRFAGAVAVAAGLSVLTGACRVDVEVGIEAGPTGGGEVRVAATLDADAVAQLGGETPEKRLALGDLTEAGWEVEGPTRLPGGGLQVEASHGFDDGEEARRLVEDVAGVDGPFRDVVLRQERTFLKTTSSFSAVADLTGGLGSFTDADLREALAGPEGAPLGVTDEQLAARFGAPVGSLFGLAVAVDLPGDATSNAPAATGGGADVWTPALGQRVVLEATSERWNHANIVAAAVCAMATVALAVVLGRRRRPDADSTPDDAGDGPTVPPVPFDQDGG